MKEKERKWRKFMFEEGNFDDWLKDQIKKYQKNNDKCEILNLDQAKKELDIISKNIDCLPQNYIKHFKQYLKDIKNNFKSHYIPKDRLCNHISGLSVIVNKLKEKQNENNKCN